MPFSLHTFLFPLFRSSTLLRTTYLSVHSTCTLFLFHPPFIAFSLCLSYSFRVLFRTLQSNPTTDSPIFPHHPLSPYHLVMLPASTGLNVFFIILPLFLPYRHFSCPLAFNFNYSCPRLPLVPHSCYTFSHRLQRSLTVSKNHNRVLLSSSNVFRSSSP